MSRVILFSLLLTFLMSCNSNKGSAVKSHEPARPLYQGDLSQLAYKLYAEESNSSFYDCDTKQRHMVYEISEALEANRANIIKIRNKKLTDDSELNILKVNDFPFIDDNLRNNPDLWEEDRYSWTEIYKTYQVVKNDLDNENWIYINSAARSLILEDETRLYYSSHPGFRLKNKEQILRVYKEVSRCFNNGEYCEVLYLSPEDRKWLREGNYHSYILDRMEENLSWEQRRKYINFLYGDLGYGAKRFEFKKNEDIKVENETLIVPLNLDVLGAESQIFTERLEKIWGLYGLAIKIVNSSEGFKVQISDTPGERAYVNRREKIMQLYAPSFFTTVYHEFGHILGLPDTYYTSFDQQTCQYVDEYNRGDIMSYKGQVLPTHIEQIKNAYGLTSAIMNK